MEITTAPMGVAGGALPLADRPKKKARPTTTSDEPQSENNNAVTVPPDAPSCKCFADVQAQFALLGYELRRHTTESGLVHRIFDEDATPKPSKASGRTTFIVGHWTGPRHLASWHGVVALLASLQDAARQTNN